MPTCANSLYLKWRDSAAEIDGLVELAKRTLELDPELEPRDVCVVAPSPSWGRTLAERLAKRAVRSSALFGGAPLAGDPRKPTTCPGWLAYAKLWLAARPQDADAQRLWRHFGTVDEGNAVVERARRLKGLALVNAVAGSPVPKDFAALMGDLEGTEDLETLFSIVHEAFTNPQFSPRTDRMRIASLKTAAQAQPHVLIVAGAVEGLLPNRTCFEDAAFATPKPKALAAAQAAFAAAAALPTRQFVVSTFQLLDGPAAQRMGVPVRRYKTVDDARMAAMAPSRFIADLGPQFPGSVSGEQHLATMG